MNPNAPRHAKKDRSKGAFNLVHREITQRIEVVVRRKSELDKQFEELMQKESTTSNCGKICQFIGENKRIEDELVFLNHLMAAMSFLSS